MVNGISDVAPGWRDIYQLLRDSRSELEFTFNDVRKGVKEKLEQLAKVG